MANSNHLSFSLTAQGDDVASQILSEAIKNYPKFAENFDQEGGDASLELKKQPTCVIQTLILFLLTGKYQGEHEEDDWCGSGFGHAVQVYQFSVDHDLDELATLAAEQFPELGESISFKDIMSDCCYILNIFNENERYLELAEYVGERARKFEDGEEQEGRVGVYNETNTFTVVDSLLKTIQLQRDQIRELLYQAAKDE
ncbi:hypothetical protein NW762_007638 [Fusarium torreyae]|uniref:Uncharacterized protein n=1 Tax=Fusarium torreyae TaxID=1237075 RepID=A0A9W8RZP5_9HYPO|nr:hypothetical protein NW762_007638 [Fusarium torreyae]